MLSLTTVFCLSVELDVSASQCRCDLRDAPYDSFLLKITLDSTSVDYEGQYTVEDTELSDDICEQLMSMLVPVRDKKI